MKGARPAWLRPTLIGLGVASALILALVVEIARTRPVRESVATYTKLLTAANHQDMPAARRLCSVRYLRTHTLTPAAEGGLVGLPRNVHPNFQAWRQGENVWLCPTNRVGPIYQFVPESGGWRFDGPVGIMRARGEIILSPDLAEPADALK